jgi:hypothetical protein
MSQRRKYWSRQTCLPGICAALLLALSAHAAPIRYQLTIPTAFINLGPTPYSNVRLVFTFTGDDSDVISGTTPSGIPGVPDISYSAIYKGVASVTVGGPAPVLTTAVFAPNQIVVNIDHNNEGIGFGLVPGGVGPSGFDVTQLQPIYPVAISNYAQFAGYTQTPAGWMNYDLTLAYARNNTNIAGGEFHTDGSVDITAAVYSCNQFGGSIYNYVCAGPAPVQTDKGVFTMGQIAEPTLSGTGAVKIGEFTAESAPATPSAPNNLSGTVQ